MHSVSIVRDYLCRICVDVLRLLNVQNKRSLPVIDLYYQAACCAVIALLKQLRRCVFLAYLRYALARGMRDGKGLAVRGRVRFLRL